MPRSPATSQAGGGGAGGRNADGRVAQPLDGGQKPPEESQPTEEEDDDDDEDRVLEVWNKWQKLNQQVRRTGEQEIEGKDEDEKKIGEEEW